MPVRLCVTPMQPFLTKAPRIVLHGRKAYSISMQDIKAIYAERTATTQRTIKSRKLQLFFKYANVEHFTDYIMVEGDGLYWNKKNPFSSVPYLLETNNWRRKIGFNWNDV